MHCAYRFRFLVKSSAEGCGAFEDFAKKCQTFLMVYFVLDFAQGASNGLGEHFGGDKDFVRI